MFLGIEIGGTKLQLGIGPGDGTLAGLWRGDVDVAAGPEGIRRRISAAVAELLAKSQIDRSRLAGVGIGFGGPVDDATHTIIKSHQIEGWDNFPLEKWISELVGLPAVLGNDADVAGLAEALFGAGKGLSPIFYITVGSGIGGALIINGEIYRGCGRGAGEIGHLLIRSLSTEPPYLNLPLGRTGTMLIKLVPVALEKMASGWAIGQAAEEFIESPAGRQSQMYRLANAKGGSVTAQIVAEAAKLGDASALNLLREASSALVEGVCNIIALFCPRRIIIGGGVSLIGEELFFQPLRQLVAKSVFKPFADCYDIVPAALGEEVVVHGALALARRRLAK